MTEVITLVFRKILGVLAFINRNFISNEKAESWKLKMWEYLLFLLAFSQTEKPPIYLGSERVNIHNVEFESV